VILIGVTLSVLFLQPLAVNPFEMAELCEPNVMRLHRICQDASLDLIADCRIVFVRVDPMLGIVFPDLEVEDFE
jgi:hypothetical protein